MKQIVTGSLAWLVALISPHGLGQTLEPVNLKQGPLLGEDSFDGTTLSDRWHAVMGNWTPSEGILKGSENPAEKHAAVLVYRQPNLDSIVSFRFKLAGIERFSFSLNHQSGHLFRVVVAPQGLLLRKDRDRSNPRSRPINLDFAEGAFSNDDWYSILIEIAGESVWVQTDNGLMVSASHPELAVEKPNYRFVMAGEFLHLDDFKLWEVESDN